MTTTLITGANRGIGLAIAKQAVGVGHAVIGTARKPGEAIELRDLGVRVCQLDTADPVSVEALRTEIDGTPIDNLINNAAIFPDRSGLDATDLDDFEATMRVNVRGPIAVTRALLENVRASERKTVATISSSMGSIAGTKSGGSYAYRASKAAVNMLMRAMSAEIEDVTFLAVDPGWVRTDMGGSDATLSTEESAAGVFGVVSNATRAQSGLFYRYDGERLDW